MEVFKENIPEMDIGTSTASFKKFLDSQNDLFNSQVDQLGSIVLKQCELTGVNPLSQEMAAGALSIKIGKRPRDLLNPKAVKYMQAVFSIKDAISKKESREIGALFGITVTQVREFFAGQRSRVRKLVRLSREKSVRSNASKELQDGVILPSDPMIPIDQAPLNSIGPSTAEEVPSCSSQAELPGLDDSERYFVENIFAMMRKEETFSGQAGLLEWILRIQNPSVLNWFLSKNGMMILATWLSQAANEEQTSVLLIILKVLCHLPLHKALPVHMSAILHSVNRLRFYRTSDISNRARVLLSRWSKMLARIQPMKISNCTKPISDAQREIIMKQSIGEIIGDESWKSEINIPALVPFSENSDAIRKSEPLQALKLLPSSADDTNRKGIRGVSQTRERRKVQLVEQPGQKTPGRSLQPGRAIPVNQGRPMSADDIQKAKLRAQFMQSKYGKIGSSSKDKHEANSEGPSIKSSTSQTSNLISATKAHAQPKIEENKKPVTLPPITSNKVEVPLPKPKLELKETLFEKCKKVQILWQAPPEVRINPAWRVGMGESSKEVEVQKNRIRREKETVYEALQDIPSNPKEPWDLEMDYDDSLTPVIPIEQPPDADSAADSLVPPEPVVGPGKTERDAVAVVASQPSSSSSHAGNASGSSSATSSAALPDLELLSVLLKNPELVFALMNGQAGGLSSEDTVRLLDMIKANGVGSLGTSLNGLGRKAEEKVEVSLPSPTPSSNPVPVPSGWRPELAKNPFSRQGITGSSRETYASSPAIDITGPARQVSMANRDVYSSAGVDTAGPAPQRQLPATNLVLPPQAPAVVPQPPQQPANFPTLSRQPLSFSLPQTTAVLPENRLQSTQQETVLNRINNFPTSGTPYPSQLSAAVPSIRVETLSNHKPGSVGLNAPERGPASYPLPPLARLTRPATQQTHSSSMLQPPEPLHPRRHSLPIGNTVGPALDSWRGSRQGLASNPTHLNHNNYNLPVGGNVLQHPTLTAPLRERNEYAFEDEFERWSPEGSPSRTPEYMLGGHNPLEPRLGSSRNHGPVPDRQRHQHRSSSGYRDYIDKPGNRRWRDRRW